MKSAALSLALLVTTAIAPLYAHAQASEIPSAAPSSSPDTTPEQRGRQLLDQMVAALGGDAWLNRVDKSELGHSAAFFRGAPNGIVVDFSAAQRFPTATLSEAERIGFITDKSIILPGKKIDIVQVWTADNGYEVTYKGRTTLPKDQVEDYIRRRNHSIENIIRVWLKVPGVMVVSEGTAMVERRLADQVTILSPNNDAVTLRIDANTHLPLRRTFQWRNNTFKDYDEDAEEYDDYHTIQGLPTAFTISRYHNGDLDRQIFYTKVQYNQNLSPDLFDPDKLLQKKK
jgi:hypothetical protein